mmetsp:Transcript_113894/g.179280  ORF Transcript_113894/g.179280 Transcript_113894/m.179280 type:complete len:104 (-) Transcript_113894:742-1053(-)
MTVPKATRMNPPSCKRLKVFHPKASSAIQMKNVEDILMVVRATADDFCVTVAPAKLKSATASMEPITDHSSMGDDLIWCNAPRVSAWPKDCRETRIAALTKTP